MSKNPFGRKPGIPPLFVVIHYIQSRFEDIFFSFLDFALSAGCASQELYQTQPKTHLYR